MEGKLIKTGDQFLLRNKEDEVIAITSGTMEGRMLSLKNCQAIENGYDLDELVREACDITDPLRLDSQKYKQDPYFKIGFIKGFQKALSILGEKKFSKNKLLVDFVYFLNDRHFNKYMVDTDEVDLYLESLQQTEWDVEVCCYIGNGDKESDSFKDPFVTNTGIPKLDSNGCLILKRK